MQLPTFDQPCRTGIPPSPTSGTTSSDRGVRPNHVHGIEGDLEDVGVRCGEPSQRIPHHILRVVDQFLHVRFTNDVPVLACP